MRVLLSAAGAAVLAVVAACSGASNPNSPTSVLSAGQWSGTTAQGTTIAFTVSADERVTAITIGHNFAGCSGSQTFSNLDIRTAPDVTCIPGPCPALIGSSRSFGYSSGNPFSGPSMDINGLFLSNARAEGSVNHRNYSGCGDAIGVGWSATRR